MATAGLVFSLIARPGDAQSPPVNLAGGVVGWYGGDWQPGIPGAANRYRSDKGFARAYDEFVVPVPGWTVAGVFSLNHMNFDGVRQASWEIRKGMSPSFAGKVVASGLSAATQTRLAKGNEGDLAFYCIQVSGLQVKLPSGTYWLSVTPVGGGRSYLSATLGANARGLPPGSNNVALIRATSPGHFFIPADATGAFGEKGIATRFSQGVIIAP